MSGWKLQRTRQCSKCPWRVDVDARDIPNGYCQEKHRALAATIAEPGALDAIGEPLRVMACHETHDSHCVGWVANQAGPGNNIALRLRLLSCANADRIRLVGQQHSSLEATCPSTEGERCPG